jgi:DNA polymerase-1
MRDPSGRPINAVYGFLAMALREIEAIGPSHLSVAFDVPIGTNHRTQIFADYKGHRPECPPDLSPQFSILQEVLTALNIPWHQAPSFEADDILGTLSHVGEQAGLDVSILTGDRDVLQLLSSQTQVRYVRKLNNPDTYDIPRFATEFGLMPTQLIDMKGLAGDASDNIPGIYGIGDKTAVKLLQAFDNVENVLDNAHTQKGKLRERLETGRDMALLSKRLATIHRSVPELPTLEQCAMALNHESGRAKFSELKFRLAI